VFASLYDKLLSIKNILMKSANILFSEKQELTVNENTKLESIKKRYLKKEGGAGESEIASNQNEDPP